MSQREGERGRERGSYREIMDDGQSNWPGLLLRFELQWRKMMEKARLQGEIPSLVKHRVKWASEWASTATKWHCSRVKWRARTEEEHTGVSNEINDGWLPFICFGVLCTLARCHTLMAYFNRTEPSLMLLVTLVLFSTMTSWNISCEKGLQSLVQLLFPTRLLGGWD